MKHFSSSSGVCTTISEAFSRDCRGLVFEPPCPDQYVADNVIVGNLIVRADPTFGGGELNISGTGMVLDGSYKQYSLMLNASTFAVQVRWCPWENYLTRYLTFTLTIVSSLCSLVAMCDYFPAILARTTGWVEMLLLLLGLV